MAAVDVGTLLQYKCIGNEIVRGTPTAQPTAGTVLPAIVVAVHSNPVSYQLIVQCPHGGLMPLDNVVLGTTNGTAALAVDMNFHDKINEIITFMTNNVSLIGHPTLPAMLP